jgi:hypothetical protein
LSFPPQATAQRGEKNVVRGAGFQLKQKTDKYIGYLFQVVHRIGKTDGFTLVTTRRLCQRGPKE